MTTPPEGDVLIHCGDFCGRSDPGQVEDFAMWMADQPHAHKIVIAGNHDGLLEHGLRGRYVQFSVESMEAMFSDRGLVYLKDSGIEIDGVKFWGSPWTPAFFDWSFMYERGPEATAQWEKIPDNTDVLITHGPPKGILDECPPYPRPREGMPTHYVHVGCGALWRALTRVQPKVHLFGHIHEGSGVTAKDGIQFVNASICTGDYRPVNPARVVDL